MKHFQVVVSPKTHQQISEYAHYIAESSGSNVVAERWANQVYDSIDRLEYFPRRFGLAEEDAHRDYAIHRQILGNYLALYTIDDESQIVRVIGFRHGKRLPRLDDLSDDGE